MESVAERVRSALPGPRLRTKLAAVVALPLLAMSVLAAVQSSNAVADVRAASERRALAEVVLALTDLQSSLRLESTIAIGATGAVALDIGPLLDNYVGQLDELQIDIDATLIRLRSQRDVVADAIGRTAVDELFVAVESARAGRDRAVAAMSSDRTEYEHLVYPVIETYVALGLQIDEHVKDIAGNADLETQLAVNVLGAIGALEAVAMDEAITTLAPVISGAFTGEVLDVDDALQINTAQAQYAGLAIQLVQLLPDQLAAWFADPAYLQANEAWNAFGAVVLDHIGQPPSELPEYDIVEVGSAAERRRGFAQELRAAYGASILSEANAAEVRAAESRSLTIGVALSMVLASLLITVSFGRRLLANLRSLEDRARQIGRGDLDLEPLDLRGGDETVVLASAFDEMAGTLKAISDGLEGLVDGAPPSSVAAPGPVGAKLSGSFSRMHELHRRTRSSEALAQGIVGNATEAIFTVDSTGTIRSANAAVGELLAAETVSFPGTSAAVISDRVPALDGFPHGLTNVPTSIIGFDGRKRSILLSTRFIENCDPPLLAVFARDVTEMHRLQERLEHEASHDHLTGVANRATLLTALDRAAERGRARRGGYGLIFCDLDKFKSVNDTLGHVAGDAVLIAVAQRLSAACREGDLVARNGGDEFVILADDVRDVAEVEVRAERLRELFSEPINVDGRTVSITASFGVAWLDPKTADGSEHLRNADVAMYQAKSSGPGQIAVFDTRLRQWVHDRAAVDRDLSAAIDNGKLDVHIRPVVDLRTGDVVGGELLSRWQRNGSFVPPDRFITVAEESNLIIDLGRYVLRRAADVLDAWSADPLLDDLFLSVNLSGRHIGHPGCADDVERILGGWKPGLLQVELTETALLQDREVAATALRALRDLGVTVAVDDFGVGHASLSYLRELPIDAIKIDRSIVNGYGSVQADTVIVQMLNQLASVLGLHVVAEGIEHAEVGIELEAAGCAYGQGYHYARPMPVADFPGWLAERTPPPARDRMADGHEETSRPESVRPETPQLSSR